MPKEELNDQETYIVRLLLGQYTQKEISQILDIPYRRVTEHKRNVMKKWDVSTTIGLAIEAIKKGYLDELVK